ncbi:lamin tail domain-containing protein [Streptomyces meridianus]|uniref:Lamin tail domain-containing protein n=1 Tax=Streptomyces meridianus TaxID=2938945 RepID=A0ABT0XDI6_9ACTN|nr:lamin tail domain-containing protein [Streptomyces meridianus]MCM2579978.1 lamin tail domain-containing protein [Streptomyces meridianus]
MSLSIRSLAATAVAAVALVGAATLPATADGSHRHGHHNGHHGHGQRGGVEISEVQYNSRGIDSRFNRSLNGEWFTVRNDGRFPVQLRNHTVRDGRGHTYRFGWLRLRGGQEVTVHTGYGRDSGSRVYQDSPRHLYSNVRGSLTLRDDEGRRLDRCAWNRWDGGHKSC